MDDVKSSDVLGNGEANEEICTQGPDIQISVNEVQEKNKEVRETKTVNDSVETQEDLGKTDFGKESCKTIIAEKEQIAEVDESEQNTESCLTRIELLYEDLLEQISSMEALFVKRIMHTDYEDKIIDQMHKELQKYKEDLYSQLLRPVLLDVIEVRDSIMRIATTYLKKPEGEQNIPNKIFADYAYDLQDILEKNSVEIYRSKNGDTYIPVKQRIVKREATNDESLHGKIAESLSCGYVYRGHVIAAEKISVYFYQKPEENKNESEND